MAIIAPTVIAAIRIDFNYLFFKECVHKLF
jgi:hypothetical protein